jgi:prophage antirepressor-like protein
MESVAAGLNSLATAKTTDPEIGALLPIYGILKNLCFETQTGGAQIWYKAKRKVSVEEAPETHEAIVNFQKSKGIRPCDLRKALILTIPQEELLLILANEEILAALRGLVTKSHDVAKSTAEVIAADKDIIDDFLRLEVQTVPVVPLPDDFKFENEKLTLGGQDVTIYLFADDPSVPWFQAKQVHNFLGATKIGHTMDRVHANDKMSLIELLSSKGEPLAKAMRQEDAIIEGGSSGDSPSIADTLNQNDKKALYVNESGFYSLIFGSEKKEAKAFQRWVVQEVLPSLRKTGSYSLKRECEDSTGSQLTKRARQGAASDELAIFESSTLVKLDASLRERFDKIQVHQKEFQEKFEACQKDHFEKLEAYQTESKNLLMNFSESVSQIRVAIGNWKIIVNGAVSQGLHGFFIGQQPTGFFNTLKNVIQGSKQRKKTTADVIHFPSTQRATERELLLQRTLMASALSQFPELTPRVFDSVKNAFGRRAKILRVFLATSASKPFLWTNSPSGGQQYVYLISEEDILRRAWTGTVFGNSPLRQWSCEDKARMRLNELQTSGEPLGDWTSDSKDLEPNWQSINCTGDDYES